MICFAINNPGAKAMRLSRLIAAVFVVAAGSGIATTASHADPYRWCAEYGGIGGGGTNCGFVTRVQCEATVSGTGGFCRLNPFYNGRPFNQRPYEYR
jgi:hypothetical protein